SISLFAQKLGLKLIANQGAVTLQAQNGPLQLHALENLDISSSSGKIAIAAQEELTLLCGGAYLRLKQDGSVEIGSPGNHTVRALNWALLKQPASLEARLPRFQIAPPCQPPQSHSAQTGGATLNYPKQESQA
ncbi:DUF2345 domain-containing protein, partial [Chromobacterium aquaticum]